MATATPAVESKELWNPFDPACRANLLRVVREEAEGLFGLAADPASWERGTASGHWQVRDIVGHMVDVTEGYLERFAGTRAGIEVPTIATLRGMPAILDEHATAFRFVPTEELLARLRNDFARVVEVFEGLSDEEWTGLNVTHGYMGPIPAFFYPTFQLVDYSIHSWDIREGLGIPQAMCADAADFLVPIMPILWQATFDPARLGERPCEIGVRVSGRNAATLRFTCTPGGLTVEAGPVDDLRCVLEFDPASLVLTAYGRMRAGTACGDRGVAARFCGLFHAI
jgi:uncharacterized protein (TIGR03083 family)